MNGVNFDIEALNNDEIQDLAKRLEPHLRTLSLLNHRIWGDPSKLHLGQGVVLNDTTFNTGSGHIHVGDHAFFGHRAMVLAGSHLIDRTDGARQTSTPGQGLDVVIGRGAWIASGAIIIGPCRIGDDAVVGAGSVVLEDVPDGWFYAGNPARPIRPVVANAKPLPSVCAKVSRVRARPRPSPSIRSSGFADQFRSTIPDPEYLAAVRDVGTDTKISVNSIRLMRSTLHHILRSWAAAAIIGFGTLTMFAAIAEKQTSMSAWVFGLGISVTLAAVPIMPWLIVRPSFFCRRYWGKFD